MEIKITTSQIEGEHQLKFVQCMKFSYTRLLIFILCCLSTGFLVALYFRWFPSKLVDMLYVPATLRNATHVRTTPYGEVCALVREGKKIQFIFRFLKYNLIHESFEVLEFGPQNKDPLSSYEVQQRQKDYGCAQMKIPMAGFFEFILEELTTPFYILQYVCVGVWLIQGFIEFAIVMMSLSLTSTFIQFYLLREAQSRLQELAAIKQNVVVFRNDNQFVIDTNQLVPGDIIQLEKMIVPADCILSGMALLNEATLTGESNPVPKSNGQILFEGTKILECGPESTAQVIRTSYSTIRGQYFRNVIFPHKTYQRFYNSAMKFLVGFLVFNLIIAASTIILYIDYSTQLIIASILATLTWILPPAMPIFFSLTASIALKRLKNNNVIGSNMDKIHISGQVDVVCFDKTGTLTTNELTVINLWSKYDCSMCISCCHHIYLSGMDLVGDVLDLEMFKFSQSKFEYIQEETLITNRENKQYKVIRIFDFNSELMMMSVIVEFEQRYYFCSKGAPEKISHKLIIQNDEAINQLQNYVNQGFRVISLVQKEITADQLNLSREELENDLQFLGYLVFENQLKYDTVSVIEHLVESNLKVKILSGDNPLTTVNAAYKIGITEDMIKLFDIKENQIIEMDIEKIQGKQQITQSKQYFFDADDFQNYLYTIDGKLALTGGFMEYCNLNNLDVHSLYKKAIVFSRVKPHQKKEAILVHQQQKSCVAMIGDGSNDCSAISQADIGVSFTSADASYTAHFSSLDQSISCIVTILAQGRATAQILSDIFPLFILLTFLATVIYTCLAWEAQNYSDIQEIYQSFICYLPIMAAMTLSKPMTRLSKALPLDDMYAMNNQLSFYTRLIIYTGGILVTVYMVLNAKGHKFQFPNPPVTEYITEGMLNTATILLHQLYCQFLPLVFFTSKPFKERFYKNVLYTGYSCFSFIATIVFIFYEDSHSFLGLVGINSEIGHFDLYLLLVAAGTISVDAIIQSVLQRKFPKRRYL